MMHGKKEVVAKKANPTIPYSKLNFAVSEQYKMLRTNLMFSLTEEKPCKVIGISSSEVSSGKSTTTFYLAHALADSKKRVLLMDGDMRRPAVARMMRLRSKQGLSDILLSMKKEELSLHHDESFPNLYVMTAGTLPPNPSELIGSKRMPQLMQILSASFDYIILDLPPVNIVTDAVAASSVIDGMLVVVRENYTEQKELKKCVQRLEQAGIKILGFVLNGTGYKKSGYGKYDKYY